jgi:hypothetical protein
VGPRFGLIVLKKRKITCPYGIGPTDRPTLSLRLNPSSRRTKQLKFQTFLYKRKYLVSTRIFISRRLFYQIYIRQRQTAFMCPPVTQYLRHCRRHTRAHSGTARIPVTRRSLLAHRRTALSNRSARDTGSREAMSDSSTLGNENRYDRPVSSSSHNTLTDNTQHCCRVVQGHATSQAKLLLVVAVLVVVVVVNDGPISGPCLLNFSPYIFLSNSYLFHPRPLAVFRHIL